MQPDQLPVSGQPLRVSSIERLHLLDDHTAWPNRIGVVLGIAGRLNQEFAGQAFAKTLTRHPLISARLSKSGSHWQTAPREEWPKFRFIEAADKDNFERNVWPAEVHGWSLQNMVALAHLYGNQCRILFLISHARVDGLGGLQFLREWMLVYNNLVQGIPVETGLPEIKPLLLRQRNNLGLLSSRYILNLWRQPIALFGASKFLFRKFASLAPDARSSQAIAPLSPGTAWPHLLTADIKTDELRAVRASCQKIGVSLNDWLVGCLFEAVQTWRSGQPDIENQPWLRMIVPISIRQKSDAAMSSANKSSLVQLDRRKEDFSPRVRLMQGIRFELGLIRSWQLDRMLLILVRGTGISPWLMRRCTRWDQNRATTMLTNLGKPLLRTGLPHDQQGRLRVGDLTLESLDLVSPVKHGMPLSVAVNQYRHRLRITVQYDNEVLTGNQAECLLEIFVGRVRTFEV